MTGSHRSSSYGVAAAGTSGLGRLAVAIAIGLVVVCPALAADAPIRADKANVVAFPAREAKYVRFVISRSSSGSPCVDELEVYAPDSKTNLALAQRGAKATASSCLAGYAIHRIAHLNDGKYGNDHSWIAGGAGESWAQIELPEATKVDRVVFSRDRRREYADRVPTHFEVQLSTDGQTWTTARKVATTAAPVAVRPRRARGRAPQLPAPSPPPGARARAVVGLDVAVPRRDEAGFANLALDPQARPAASSEFPGHAIHKIAHLNDGQGGNQHSWISKGEPSWAEIDLGGVYWVYKVAFGSDSSMLHNDRAATSFSVRVATEYNTDTSASTWTTVHKQSGGEPVHVRRELKFKPVQARWVRVAIDASNALQVRIDEIEVYGQADPIPAEKVGSIRPQVAAASTQDEGEQLRYAFLGEEHAWLKTYGRADLSRRLVPYNGRVKEYPRHVGDDHLPLPPLPSAPVLDGDLGDACWQVASRGVARVAHPYDFEAGPLVNHEVTAGWRGDALYMAIRVDRLLSRHVAVVSSGDWRGCGIVVCGRNELMFNRYKPDGTVRTSTPVEGAFDRSHQRFEFCLPLSLLPECRSSGVRVGLGMGGKHTDYAGRAVHFAFSSLAIAEQTPCVGRTFRVRLSAASGTEGVTVRGNAPGTESGFSLAPGASKVLIIPADRGAIGPSYTLTIREGEDATHTLHLFRYDPLERTLTLMAALVDRLAAKGLDVGAEHGELSRLRVRHDKLLTAPVRDLTAERQAFFQARLAKRRLLMREPDLEPMARILFVKRRPFEPSHNYSVLLDSRYRPGGGVCVLEIPRRDGRLEPDQARVTELFSAGGGIARTPMADFDVSKVYFAYRPSADGYYHLMRMNLDGSGLKQLTDGPFHDYWPCPLPDGGVAFITTRCKARYLCWRPQVALMFRMNPEGGDMMPLSHANLSEWAPSVMNDGRIIWTRSEYIDKGADFSHTLWAIRPDGAKAELVFGNTIIQPNGYANGREVPGTNEICCTLISHFGDLNGPITFIDIDQGRFSPEAITSLTPEVPWPGMWPVEECFRDPVPVARDYVLCSHAPQRRFGLYLIDRFGNRELVYLDDKISSVCPTLLRRRPTPPVLARSTHPEHPRAEVVLLDVYQGISPPVRRGQVKYIRVVEEVRANLERLPDGQYRHDHPDFIKWYAAPIDKVHGPCGWPSYVAKAPWGLVPVEADGSARFTVPAGKTLYFQALDEDYNELQRMRSVVQFQPGETRSCIGCHEGRHLAPRAQRRAMAMDRAARTPQAEPWGAQPLSYAKVVQPVLDAKCVRCHNADHKMKLDFRGDLDQDRIPASYRTLISRGLVHHADYGWNSGGCEKLPPMSLGSIRSELCKVLEAGHHDVKLTRQEMRRIKTWIDLNCPLWPDYLFRPTRPALAKRVSMVD